MARGATATPRTPGRGVAFLHASALGAAGVVIALTAHSAHWRGVPMAVIGTFTIMSGLTYVAVGSRTINIQGTPLGLVLAAVLLGPGPAAVLGAITIAVMHLRLRAWRRFLANNLVTFVWYPLVGGLVFHGIVALAHLHRDELGYYAAVIPSFVAALTVNFVGVVGYECWLDRSSLIDQVRPAVVPVLPADLVASFLTMGAVFIAVHTGTLGIVLLGMMLLVFQYLVGELLKSQSRGEELHRRATTDELTGLANRDAFTARVEETIAAADEQTRLALLLIDLDRFKEINDTLGHHYGDQLLREIGPRLVACAGEDGLVARLGGDEFVVLPGEMTDVPATLQALAGRLLASIQEPFRIDELPISIGASIGISRFPVDGRDLNELLRRADIAMYAAKAAHIGCRLYAADFDHHSVRRLSLLGDFQRGLSAEELVVHYQPIVDPVDLTVRGAEGLVRWEHPHRGLLLPGDFIDTVEQTDMIRPMTLLVLERAIAQCAAWHRAGHALAVAVNLSVRNLLDPTLPREIQALLDRYSVAPGALQLEITESMIMADRDRVLVTVTQLNALGVRLSVDDFGTGFSSLANLKHLPINELKIDRSFVSPMLGEDSDLIIVRSTINLAHDLGLRVVAEGVEDASTLDRLATMGCDLAQGFHVSRPLAPQTFTDWLDQPGEPTSRRASA